MLSPERCHGRMQRFSELIGDQGFDMAVVADTKSIAYLTGFLRSDLGVSTMKHVLLLVYPDNGPLLLNSRMFAAQAQKTYHGEMLVYADYDIHHKMVTHLEDALPILRERLTSKPKPLNKIGIEGRYLFSGYLTLLNELYPSSEFTDISNVLPNMRRIKEEDEVALIRQSEAQIVLAYRTIKEAIVAGSTEMDAFLAGTVALSKEIDEPTFFNGDFVSGERAVDIGGPPTGRVLKSGDMFIFDLWTTTHGYWADTCRTFVVGGKPTAEQNRMHDVVCKAVDAGEALLRPGVPARDVYRAMYDTIADEGYGDHFPHHGGHGFGLYAHESPFFIPAADEILEEGMTCTLEPGVYVEGIGGVRSEDNYLITNTGMENLTPYPRGL